MTSEDTGSDETATNESANTEIQVVNDWGSFRWGEETVVAWGGEVIRGGGGGGIGTFATGVISSSWSTSSALDRVINTAFQTFGSIFSNGGQVDTGPLSSQEIAGLRAILERRGPTDAHSYGGVLGFRSGGKRYSVVTEHGGYGLLVPVGGTDVYMVNVDIGAMVSDERLAEYRRIIFDLEASIKAAGGDPVKLITAGQTAFYYGPGSQPLNRRSIRAVDRRDLESVFSMRHSSTGEEVFFLSGYDTQEKPPLYFLCRLPHAVGSVEEAYDALMPNSVKTALRQGKTVVRQGDLFAIETDMDDDALLAAGGSIQPGEWSWSLYGTAHTGTRCATFDNGIQAATGHLVHNPELLGEARPPDHSVRKLSGKWWWIIKNTVPVSGTALARRRQHW